MGAVVDAALGDVDRDVADQSDAALGGVGAQRRPLAVEADLVVDAAAGGAPSPRSSRRSRGGTRSARAPRPARRARARKPFQAANAEADAYGEPTSSGGPSGSTCHQLCPAAASQSTNAYASASSVPLGQRGRVQHDAARSLKLHRLFDRSPFAESLRTVPTPSAKHRRPGSRSRTCARRSTADAIPSRRTDGDRVDVSATIFKDGHDILRAVVRYRRPARAGGSRRRSSRSATTAGRAASSRRGSAAGSSRSRPGSTATRRCSTSSTASSPPGRPSSPASSPRRRRSSARASSTRGARPRRSSARRTGTARRRSPKPLEVDVERERARFGAWYELFPRSWGGFKGVAEGAAAAGRARLRRRLPAADPSDRDDEPQGPEQRARRRRRAIPGSPWAIGGPEGGHDAIHPELGTLKEFDALVAAARKHGLEIALDFAIQCSPDHPWLKEHPEWFNRRPDGTLKYAENPPKRYQDIYNVNFDSEDWRGLWEALRDVVLHWCRHGVRAFRVDNPHTKSVPFWEWLIAEVRAEFPDTIFFAEAFTRPAMMTTLAKIGFSQSYTYFTWKNTKAELRRVPRSSCSSGRPTTGRTSSPTRPTSSTSTCRRAAGRPSRRGSCSRRRSRPRTGSTPATSTSRTCPSRTGARSTSTRRSTRSSSARSTGRCCRSCGG